MVGENGTPETPEWELPKRCRRDCCTDCVGVCQPPTVPPNVILGAE